MALSISRRTRDWLGSPEPIRVLHVFESAVNLIADDGEIISFVTPAIGNGPFNIVLPALPLNAHITSDAKCDLNPGIASIDGLFIRLSDPDTQIWEPRFPWSSLDPTSDETRLILAWLDEFLTKWVPSSQSQSPTEEWESSLSRDLHDQLEAESKHLFPGITDPDLDMIKGSATRLVGLGQGITPDGDDIMLGALLAAWMTQPIAFSIELGEAIVESAADRTTPISLAWLMAAARGECTEHWHSLLKAICTMSKEEFLQGALQIYRQGHSSGWSGLRGFMGVLRHFLDIS